MDNSRFRETFIEEASEYLEDIETSLLKLEKFYSKEAVDDIFRAMHSLKGGASMFGFPHINRLTHELESLYEQIREGERSLDEEGVSLTFRSVDFIKQLLKNDDKPTSIDDYETYVKKLKNIGNAAPEIQPSAGSSKTSSAISTYIIHFKPGKEILKNGINPVYLMDELINLGEGYPFARIRDIPSFHKMDPQLCYIFWDVVLATEVPEEEIREVFLFIEDDSDIIIEKIAPEDLLALEEVRKLLSTMDSSQEISAERLASYAGRGKEQKQAATEEKPRDTETLHTIRVASSKIDELINVVGEVVTFESRLSMFASQLRNSELDELREGMEKITARLREVTFDISLVPLSTMMLRFQRLVRDLSQEQGKQVFFDVKGAETQLDKTIIEHLYEPVLHIIRNSISHGIEDSKTRKSLGKPEVGTIALKAYYSGPEVHIDISDDGRGFDLKRIKDKAVEAGLAHAGEQRSDQDWLRLTMTPGFTTAQKTDGISGRGVGMDVIKRKLEEVKGDVSIFSESGKGTKMTLAIPLTLSIVEGLTVKSDNRLLVIPVSNIQEIVSISHKELMRHNHVMVVNGYSIPFAPLFFQPAKKKGVTDVYPVVIVQHQDKKYGLVVHSVEGHQQVVLKPLGNYLRQMDVFSGGCLLGDGTIGFVLDVKKYITYASKVGTIKNQNHAE